MKRGQSHKHFAHKRYHAVWIPAQGRDDSDDEDSDATTKKPYATPSVSNIAALMASAVDLPAHTTNWNAGK